MFVLQQQIEAALDEVCSRLSGDLSTECTAFINLYAPVIIDLLEQELDPTVICDKIGLCTPLKLHKSKIHVQHELSSLLILVWDGYKEGIVLNTTFNNISAISVIKMFYSNYIYLTA